LKNIDPLAFIFIQTFTANVLINIYVILFEKYDINKTTMVIAPICGILFSAGCIAFLKALSYADISLISPVLQMNFILTYILGLVFLKESITGRKILGIACVIIAITMLSFWKT
ncbi:MAG: EamA family transporter, partial [Spirochaetes bacterium]|nr:EamA family transporter [Spirochaetota bacterium]